MGKDITLKCTMCGKEYIAKSSKSRYCSNECKLKVKYQKDKEKALLKRGSTRNCIICNEIFEPAKSSSKCCSDKCKQIHERNKVNSVRHKQRDDLFKNKVEGVDYVVCKICGMKSPQINSNHLLLHGITAEQYLRDYKGAKLSCESFTEHYKGDKNPNSKVNTTYEERQERSPFSDKFYEKRNIEISQKNELISDIHKDMVYNTQLEFYINKGFDKKDANNLLTERQKTFSLEKCIKKYGDIEGRIKWEERQEKWCESFIKSFKNNGHAVQTSKIAVQFINEILQQPNINDLLYCENELRINKYFYDLTNASNKRIIEFNGDYWHCNPNKYNGEYFNKRKQKYAKEIWEFDEMKIKTAEDNGYKVLVIWESDYNKDPEGTIKLAKEFLYE